MNIDCFTSSLCLQCLYIGTSKYQWAFLGTPSVNKQTHRTVLWTRDRSSRLSNLWIFWDRSSLGNSISSCGSVDTSYGGQNSLVDVAGATDQLKCYSRNIVHLPSVTEWGAIIFADYLAHHKSCCQWLGWADRTSGSWQV